MHDTFHCNNIRTLNCSRERARCVGGGTAQASLSRGSWRAGPLSPGAGRVSRPLGATHREVMAGDGRGKGASPRHRSAATPSHPGPQRPREPPLGLCGGLGPKPIRGPVGEGRNDVTAMPWPPLCPPQRPPGRDPGTPGRGRCWLLTRGGAAVVTPCIAQEAGHTPAHADQHAPRAVHAHLAIKLSHITKILYNMTY